VHCLHAVMQSIMSCANNRWIFSHMRESQGKLMCCTCVQSSHTNDDSILAVTNKHIDYIKKATISKATTINTQLYDCTACAATYIHNVLVNQLYQYQAMLHICFKWFPPTHGILVLNRTCCSGKAPKLLQQFLILSKNNMNCMLNVFSEKQLL